MKASQTRGNHVQHPLKIISDSLNQAEATQCRLWGSITISQRKNRAVAAKKKAKTLCNEPVLDLFCLVGDPSAKKQKNQWLCLVHLVTQIFRRTTRCKVGRLSDNIILLIQLLQHVNTKIDEKQKNVTRPSTIVSIKNEGILSDKKAALAMAVCVVHIPTWLQLGRSNRPTVVRDITPNGYLSLI